MTREEINDIINDINSRKPEFLGRDKHKGFLCPKCNSGRGKNGTGISPIKKTGRYHCLACGLTEDVIGLWQIHSGMTGEANFLPAVESCAAHYGIYFPKYDGGKQPTAAEIAKWEETRKERQAAIQAQMEQDAREAAKVEEYKAASRKRAKELYICANPATNADAYIKRKFIDVSDGVRRGTYESDKYAPSKMGACIVPVWNAATDELQGLQYLLDEPITHKETGQTVNKIFHYGTILENGYFPITPPKDKPARVFIAEGYATAYSVAEIDNFFDNIFVAFSCQNIPKVYQTLKAKHPQAHFIIAADNDRKADGGNNAGMEAAQKCPGAYVVAPTDTDALNGQKDWNDIISHFIAEETKNFVAPPFVTDETERANYKATAEKQAKEKALKEARKMIKDQLQDQKPIAPKEPTDAPQATANTTPGQTTTQPTAAQEQTGGRLKNYEEVKGRKITPELRHRAALEAGNGLDVGMCFYAPYIRPGSTSPEMLPLKLRGLTLIGARTAGGKTLTLINFAARVLLQPEKRILFITLEDDIYSAFDKLVCAYSALPNNGNISEITMPDLYKIVCMGEQYAKDSPENAAKYDSYLKISKVINDRVVFVGLDVEYADNAERLGVEYIAKHQQEHGKNSVIFLDYFQTLYVVGGKDGYAMMKACVNALRPYFSNAAQNIIAGVQFNREQKPPTAEKLKKDGMTKAQWEFRNVERENIREAADLEQAAYTLIYTMKQEQGAEITQHFKILKIRGKGTNFTSRCDFNADSYFLNFKNSHASDLSETATPVAKDGNKTESKEKNASKQPGLFGHVETVAQLTRGGK